MYDDKKQHSTNQKSLDLPVKQRTNLTPYQITHTWQPDSPLSPFRLSIGSETPIIRNSDLRAKKAFRSFPRAFAELNSVRRHGGLQTADRRSQVAGRRSQVAGRRSQVAGRRSQVAGRRSQVAGRRSQVAGRRLQVAGCRLQVDCCRWIDRGCGVVAVILFFLCRCIEMGPTWH